MPQFQPVFIVSQLFWLYVIFGVLMLVLSTFALPKIGNVLEDRQRRIDNDLDRAGVLKTEAEAALANYEKALADSRTEAKRILKEAGDAIVHRSEEAQKALGARLGAQVKDGEARVHAAKAEALGHVQDIAQAIAEAAAVKLLGAPVVAESK